MSYILCSCQMRITLLFFERKCRRRFHSFCAETISFLKLFEQMIDDSEKNNTNEDVDDDDNDDDDVAIQVIAFFGIALVALGFSF